MEGVQQKTMSTRMIRMAAVHCRLVVTAMAAMLALAPAAALQAAAAEPIMISVKLVKQEVGRSTAPPRLEFLAERSAWQVVDQPYHHGENDWEVFFEIETDASSPPLEEMAFVVPGVQAARVIVGKTDVPFTQVGDRIRFRLVDDRARGQHMETKYESPRGGYPIFFRHNWKMRRAGKYAEDPYPATQIEAIKNYLLAAQEVLRAMGGMGPEPPKDFQGEIVLMDTEVATTRGHLDYPPHVHIMFYEFAERAGGEPEWVRRLVPHFYMDSEGHINRNSYAVVVGPEASAALGPGDVVRFEDSIGNEVLQLTIAAEGLVLREAGGVSYSLRPDPEQGAAHAVWGYRGEEVICRAAVRDDPADGILRLQLDLFEKGRRVATVHDGYRYDPFTASYLGRVHGQIHGVIE